MNLFFSENLLPFDGAVEYFPSFIGLASSSFYFQKLEGNIYWQHDVVRLFGKEITTNRKTAWYGSQSFEYTYSNKTKIAIPWNKELIELKTIIEKLHSEN